MARVKFLDVLEETRTRPAPRQSFDGRDSEPFSGERQDRFESPRDSGAYGDRFESEYRIPRRETVAERYAREPRPAYETGYSGRRDFSARPQASASKASSFLNDENRMLWTGALFIFFGGMLFLTGYWLGKAVTSRVKSEGLASLSEARDFRREELGNAYTVKDLPPISPPKAVTVDVPQPAPKPTSQAAKKVTPKPAPAAPKKPAVVGEFVVQVSAHTSIEAARLVEDKLVSAGYSAYTSESLVGNNRYFRVRIRGFNNKNDAEKVLASIKTLGLGADGYVLKLD